MSRLNRSVYRAFAALAFATATAGSAWGQAQGAQGQLLHPIGGAAPSFEVATVKPNHDRADVFSFNLQPSRFKANAAPLNRLIRFAYDVKSDQQILNMPDWASSEDFDIDAKIGDAVVDAMKQLTPEQRFIQYRLMVQSLLADRFQMRVTTTTRELPVYALVVTKGGPKFHTTPEAQVSKLPQLHFTSAGDLKASSVSMAFFAGWLSGKPDTSGRVVEDATSLIGLYDFSLNYDPVGNSAAMSAAYGNQTANTAGAEKLPLLSAIQEQLGLKLESRKAPVEVLVIDHMEQPSPN